MKAQAGRGGKGGSQRSITEKGNAAVSKAGKKTLRPEAPGKAPGYTSKKRGR